jgi:hypothetical protein
VNFSARARRTRLLQAGGGARRLKLPCDIHVEQTIAKRILQLLSGNFLRGKKESEKAEIRVVAEKNFKTGGNRAVPHAQHAY